MNKVKRIAAITGIVLIVAMYLITFISAFFVKGNAFGFFLASIFCTIAIPIMLYGFITVYKYVHRNDKQNISDKLPEADKKAP